MCPPGRASRRPCSTRIRSLSPNNDWRGEPRTRGRQEGGSRGPRRWRLRGLQRLCGGLPDGHRHPAMASSSNCITCSALQSTPATRDGQRPGKEAAGLIAYATLADYNHNPPPPPHGARHRRPALPRSNRLACAAPDGASGPIGVRGLDLRRIIRPRTFIYLAVWGGGLIGLVPPLRAGDPRPPGDQRCSKIATRNSCFCRTAPSATATRSRS